MKRTTIALIVGLVCFVAISYGATLSRLHSSEISNGNAINATHLNNEFNQLVNESNAQDVRLDTIESGTFDQTGTLQVSGTFQVDAVAELTAANGVTIDGLLIKDGDIPNFSTQPTGSVSAYFGASAPTGWVLLDGDTIGNASSGATERANADTEELFELVWAECADAQCAVSSGRGASAQADYDANKTITLPDMRGRMILGMDNMGGASANVVTNSKADTMGDKDGEENHTLTTAEMPSHTHSGTKKSNSQGSGGGSFNFSNGDTTTGSAGSDQAHNNMPPWLAMSYIIKL